MAAYTNDLRLKEIATGDEAGTWGSSTNTNLELIAEAFSFGTEAITTNADTHTTTIADGSTDPGRSLFLKYTGTLDSTCTITIGPNTVSKLWFIENATSGSQSIIIKQGSGATITVPNGQVKAIYSDGAGSGGAMVDAFTDLSVPSLFVSGALDVTGAITSSAGATITVADNSDNLTLVSTDADANFGPNLNFYRNSSSPADDDLLAQIDFNGRNDNSQDVLYANIQTQIIDASDGTEDGRFQINTIVAGTDRNRFLLTPTETVFNDNSIDLDFRVESNGQANMLLVDGGDDVVKIGGITGSASGTLKVKSNSSHFALALEENSGNEAYQLGVVADGSLVFTNSGSTEVMRLSDSNNVGIGATTVDHKLHLEQSDTTVCFTKTENTAGNLLVGVNSSGNSFVSAQTSGKPLILETQNTERARITDSGIFLVGKTASGTANTGAELRSGVSNHAIVATSSSEVPVIVNRRDNDGSLINLFRQQTHIGSIGVLNTNNMTVMGTAADHAGIQFGTEAIFPMEGGSDADGTISFGSSSGRYKDIFATNGTIQTSDRNEKQDIEELSDAEQRVAVAAKGLLRKYRWKSAVVKKGDNARIHFGIIAQDLQDAFTAEGLDAGRYAMFCSDTWTNDDGSEQTRLGIRYPQLLAFIIAAI